MKGQRGEMMMLRVMMKVRLSIEHPALMELRCYANHIPLLQAVECGMQQWWNGFLMMGADREAQVMSLKSKLPSSPGDLPTLPLSRLSWDGSSLLFVTFFHMTAAFINNEKLCVAL